MSMFTREAQERIQTLEDRIADLEAALGMCVRLPKRLYRKLGLLPASEMLLGILDAQPFVSREAIFLAMYENRSEAEQPDPKLIDVYLSRIRTALRPYGIVIQREWGRGWYITDADKAKLAALVAAHETNAVGA